LQNKLCKGLLFYVTIICCSHMIFYFFGGGGGGGIGSPSPTGFFVTD
jgi:hypothetical protein